MYIQTFPDLIRHPVPFITFYRIKSGYDTVIKTNLMQKFPLDSLKHNLNPPIKFKVADTFTFYCDVDSGG